MLEYEEQLVSTIVGFSNLIRQIESSLPDSEYKTNLIDRLRHEKAALVVQITKLMMGEAVMNLEPVNE